MQHYIDSPHTEALRENEPLLSIIVPTYNERDNVGPLAHSISASLKNVEYKIIFVDDSSPDGTAEAIRKLEKDYPIDLIVRPRKMGLGSAVMTGVGITSSPYIIVMDADLQHDPQLLTQMVEKLETGYDLVVASRKIKGGTVIGWSTTRKLVSDVATRLAYIFIPETRIVKDPLSGFFGFNKHIMKGVRLEPKGFKILIEILAKAHYSKVCEIPFIFRGRKHGKSKLSLNEYILFIALLLGLRIKKLNHTNSEDMDWPGFS